MDSEIQALKSGDTRSLTTLVDVHYDAVFKFCSYRVGSSAAEDVVQDVFITIFRSIKSFRGESSLKTWIFGIALNHCRQYLRKRGDEYSISTEAPSDESTESQVIQRQFLVDALQKLSHEHREVVVLHEFDGFKYEEIAQLLKIPLGTVKSRLFHAFDQLRTELTNSEVAS